MDNLERVYGRRFSEDDAARKDAIWREITGYLQRYVDREGTVLDVACDHGDFIRNIAAGEKWATDVRDVSHHLPAAIRFVQADGLSLSSAVPRDHFDVVFMSNYLEHLPSSDAVLQQLHAAWEVLKRHGRLLVLQPNIRYVGNAYWDFLDHKTALTDRSLVEAAEIAGFRTVEVLKRFLPYTTKSRLPQHPALVRAYLAFPPVWRLFGKQTLYVGEKS